jgi:drug/metabolite transporter (DMT)-like permease
MGAIVLASAGPRIPGRGSVPALVACGVLAVLGQASYIAATHHGLLSVVVVLASLYPVATVSLAWVIEHERLTHRQLFGLGLAIVAVALIASS